MNTTNIRSRIVSLAAAATLALAGVAGLSVGQVAAASPAVVLSTYNPAVGQSINATPSGFAPVIGGSCTWMIGFPTQIVAGVGGVGGTSRFTEPADPSGQCTPWTFTLPALDQVGLAAYIGVNGPTMTPEVWVGLQTSSTRDPAGPLVESGDARYTYRGWSGSAIPSSSIPGFWFTLSNTHPALNATVTVSIYRPGLTTAGCASADWWIEQDSMIASGGMWRETDGTQVMNPYPIDSTTQAYTFTMAMPRMRLSLYGECDDDAGHPIWHAQALVEVLDPPDLGAPNPTDAPTTAPTALPTDSPTDAPTAASGGATPSPTSTTSARGGATPPPTSTGDGEKRGSTGGSGMTGLAALLAVIAFGGALIVRRRRRTN